MISRQTREVSQARRRDADGLRGKSWADNEKKTKGVGAKVIREMQLQPDEADSFRQTALDFFLQPWEAGGEVALEYPLPRSGPGASRACDWQGPTLGHFSAEAWYRYLPGTLD